MARRGHADAAVGRAAAHVITFAEGWAKSTGSEGGSVSFQERSLGPDQVVDPPPSSNSVGATPICL